MGYRRVGVAAVCAMVVLAGGCGGGASTEAPLVEPLLLELPAADSVALIQTSGETLTSIRLSEPEAIAEVLDVLGELSAGWESTTEPLPAYVYSTSMSAGGNKILLAAWIGEDWIAANDMLGRGFNVRQPLTAAQRASLLRSLGVEGA